MRLAEKIGKFLVPEFVPIPLELLQDPKYVSKIKSPQIKTDKLLRFFEENPIGIDYIGCAPGRLDKWRKEMEESNRRFKEKEKI